MNKTIEERAKELYPESDNPILDELRERQRAAYIAGATENISGVTSTNTQVTTICAKELLGEAGCKELCDECKHKRDRFAAVSTEAEGWKRVEELVKSDPISFFMTNIMRYMNEEQIKVLIEKLIRRYPAPPTVTKSVEREDEGLGICVECKKGTAVKDYNGHKHYVCEPCYKSLDNEFEDEYR